jgi:hypothetical protein
MKMTQTKNTVTMEVSALYLGSDENTRGETFYKASCNISAIEFKKVVATIENDELATFINSAYNAEYESLSFASNFPLTLSYFDETLGRVFSAKNYYLPKEIKAIVSVSLGKTKQQDKTKHYMKYSFSPKDVTTLAEFKQVVLKKNNIVDIDDVV